MEWFLFLLAAYGVVFFIQHKLVWLHTPIRERFDIVQRLIVCTFCLGAEVGAVLWLAAIFLCDASLLPRDPAVASALVQGVEVLMMGFAVGAWSWFCDALLQKLED